MQIDPSFPEVLILIPIGFIIGLIMWYFEKKKKVV